MKLIALTAAIALGGGAALAQNVPAQETPQQVPSAQQEAPPPDTPPAASASENAAAPAPAPAPAPATGATNAGGDPIGGYAPSAPALSGTPAPGAQVVVNPSPAPSQAFPPPAPLQHYPICKRGQFDDCMQRGG